MELCGNMLISPIYAFSMTIKSVYGSEMVPEIAELGLNQKGNDDKNNKSFDTFIRNRTYSHRSFKEILGDEIVKSKGQKDDEEFQAKKEMREEMKKCNHNPNDEHTSLRKLSKRIMIQPLSYYYVCPCCNQGFRFNKTSDGKLVEVKESL